MRRRAERSWLKNPTQKTKDIYVKQRLRYVKLLRSEKQFFYNSLIEGTTSQKEMYNILNGMLGNKYENELPDHDNDEIMANDFLAFFRNKVVQIKESFDQEGCVSLIFPACQTNKSFSDFQLVAADDVSRILSAMSSKTCELDLIPTSIVK